MKTIIDRQRNRKSIRLKNYDYTQDGGYFITIVSHDRRPIFGEIKNGIVIKTALGEIAEREWMRLKDRFPSICLDEFIIMPNHIHAVLFLESVNILEKYFDRENLESFQKPVKESIPTIIRAFKASVSYRASLINPQRDSIWQRNYFEHIIRNEEELSNIRRYIVNNPIKWGDDLENPL